MGSNDEATIQRILRQYNDLPFRVFREATPVQVLTAFHHLILRLHADLGFNFSTVNSRTHERFARSMAVLGLESYTPSLTSITRLDKPVLVRAFNVLIDMIESRYLRSIPIDEGCSVDPNNVDIYATLPRPRSKRMSMVTMSSTRPAMGLPKARSKRLSMAEHSISRPSLSSSLTPSTPRRSLNLSLAPLRKPSVSTPLRKSVPSLKSVMPVPSSPVVSVPSRSLSTPVKQSREVGRLSSTTRLPGSSSQGVSIQITPRAIKARLSLLPVNTPTSQIPSLRQPRKPRPSVVPVIVPAKLPDGFDEIENPFKTKAKLKSTPVAARVAANRKQDPKVTPLKLAEIETEAFETKHKIARTPDAPAKRNTIRQSGPDSITSETCSVPDNVMAQGKLASLYNRFLLTDNDDNLPLRTIRKLIKAQKDAVHKVTGGEENCPITDQGITTSVVQKAPIRKEPDSGDKENRNEAKHTRQKAVRVSSAKDSPGSAISENRPVRRSRRPIVPTDDADHSEDDLVREASALLQRCELSDDEQSRKRAVNGRKLMEAIVTIRKSVAPRRRRKGK